MSKVRRNEKSGREEEEGEREKRRSRSTKSLQGLMREREDEEMKKPSWSWRDPQIDGYWSAVILSYDVPCKNKIFPFYVCLMEVKQRRCRREALRDHLLLLFLANKGSRSISKS